MNERDTPEVDQESYQDPTPGYHVVTADFARRLERQRDEYLEQSASYIGKLAEMNIKRHIAESQRDELLEALEWLDNCVGHKPMPECSERIRAAIASVKGGGK